MTPRAGKLRDLFAFIAVTVFLFMAAVSVDAYLGYRKLARGDQHEEIRGVHDADDRLGWAPVPGSTGTHWSDGNFDVRYGIDERGFRRVANRGAAERHVYLFGDSFTFGHGVDDDATFASLMAARHLRSGVHVVNTGVMGYGFPQMLQRLLDVEAEIDPGDVVIFAPTSGDIERNLRFFTYPSRHLFRRSKGNVTWFPDFRDGRLVTTRLDTPGNHLKALIFHARFTGPGFQRFHHLFSGVDPQRDSREMIDAAREIAQRRRARFALVFLPHPAECLEGSYTIDVSSFDFYDLMDFFPSTKPEVDAIHFPADSHWNRRGHEIAAAALVEILAAGGVLGPELLARREPRGES